MKLIWFFKALFLSQLLTIITTESEILDFDLSDLDSDSAFVLPDADRKRCADSLVVNKSVFS